MSVLPLLTAVSVALSISMVAPEAGDAHAFVDYAIAAEAAADTDTVRLKVEGMTCGGCAVSARLVLQRLDGVSKAHVDYDSKIALVVFDAKRVAPERMIQALKEKLKYAATVVPQDTTDSE